MALSFHVSLYKRVFLVVNSFTFPAEIPQWQGHGLLSVSQAFLVILTGARFLILQRCPSLSMSYSSLNAWEVARRGAMWSQDGVRYGCSLLRLHKECLFLKMVLSLESSIIINTIEILWAKTHVKELLFKPFQWQHLGPLCTRNLIKASIRRNNHHWIDSFSHPTLSQETKPDFSLWPWSLYMLLFPAERDD